MRIRRRFSGGLLRTAPASQDFGQLGLGLIEFADSLLAVDLDRQRHRRTQQQPFRRRLGYELVIGPEAQCAAKLRGERHDAAARESKGGFHDCSLAVFLHFCKPATLKNPNGSDQTRLRYVTPPAGQQPWKSLFRLRAQPLQDRTALAG